MKTKKETFNFSKMVHLQTKSTTPVIFSTRGFLVGGLVVDDQHDGHLSPPIWRRLISSIEGSLWIECIFHTYVGD